MHSHCDTTWMPHCHIREWHAIIAIQEEPTNEECHLERNIIEDIAKIDVFLEESIWNYAKLGSLLAQWADATI